MPCIQLSVFLLWSARLFANIGHRSVGLCGAAAAHPLPELSLRASAAVGSVEEGAAAANQFGEAAGAGQTGEDDELRAKEAAASAAADALAQAGKTLLLHLSQKKALNAVSFIYKCFFCK